MNLESKAGVEVVIVLFENASLTDLRLRLKRVASESRYTLFTSMLVLKNVFWREAINCFTPLATPCL